MAAGDGSNERAWSDLPADLLVAVYRRCSTAYDRARFAAVCAPWRAAVLWHPLLPALPLLLPWPSAGGREAARAYSPEDGRAVRVALPSAMTPGMRLVGCHDGGWIAATSTTADHQHQVMIVNLHSGVEVALSAKQRAVECAWSHSHAPIYFDSDFKAVTVRPAVKKIVFSGDPSSSCCILAATTGICKLALCRVDCPDNGWTTAGCAAGGYEELVDISFCNGELNGLSGNSKLFLYGIVRSDQLLKFVIAMNGDGAAPVIAVTHVIAGLKAGIPRSPCWVTYHAQHIFELHGKMAIAVERTNIYGQASYGVYELANYDEKTQFKYTLMEVTSLDDHALFLSPACSKVVHVSAAGARGGVYRNCIYYLKGHLSPFEGESYMKRLDLGSCVVYSWGYRYVHYMRRIMSKVYHYRCNKDRSNGFMWFLPPDF